MPKATKGAQCEQCNIEHVLPEETSDREETNFECKHDVEHEVTPSLPHAFPSIVYALYRGPKNGLDC